MNLKTSLLFFCIMSINSSHATMEHTVYYPTASIGSFFRFVRHSPGIIFSFLQSRYQGVSTTFAPLPRDIRAHITSIAQHWRVFNIGFLFTVAFAISLYKIFTARSLNNNRKSLFKEYMFHLVHSTAGAILLAVTTASIIMMYTQQHQLERFLTPEEAKKLVEYTMKQQSTYIFFIV